MRLLALGWFFAFHAALACTGEKPEENLADVAEGGRWAGTWGGADPNFTTALRVALDSSGNAYVVGTFGAMVDFDPGPGVLSKSAAQPVSTDGPPRDAYLLKLDARHEVVWVRSWGGSAYDYATDVAVDTDGNVYVAGYVYSASVAFDPPSPGFEMADSSWALDTTKAYVLKYGADGVFRWARAWTVEPVDPSILHPTLAFGVAVDAAGNVYVVGDCDGAVDFDGTDGIDVRNANTDGHVYLASYAASGSYRWVRTFGNGRAESAAFDRAGGIVTTGYTLDTADWDPGPGDVTHAAHGRQDVFTSRFSTDGAFQWCRFVEGDSHANVGRSVVADGSGNVYVAGAFAGTATFDGAAGHEVHRANGSADDGGSADTTDAFLIKYANDGSYVWGLDFGGGGVDVANGLALDPAGGVGVTGVFTGTVDLDPGPATTAGTGNPTSFFVSRFRSDGSLRAVATGGPSVGGGGFGVAVDRRSWAYVAGTFWGTVDFDPGEGGDRRTASGGADAFLWHLVIPPVGSTGP